MNLEQVEEIKRHFGVVAEGLRDEIRALAKGQQRLAASLDALRQDVAALRKGQESLREELTAFKRPTS